MIELRKSPYNNRAAGALYSVALIIVFAFTLVFSVALVIFNVSFSQGEPKPDWYLYCSYLIPQLAFAFAVVLFFIFTDARPREVYKGAKWQYFFLAIFLQFGLFSLSGLNGLFLQFLQQTFGYAYFAQIPSVEGWKIIPVLLTVALLPAVFEESIFRGIILSPMKNFSTPAAILLSGVLFALYHQNPSQTIYQFCCGCAFALVAIRANSVLPTMISHFLNNAVIIVLQAFGISDFTGMGGVIFCIVSSVALIAVFVYLIVFDRKSNTKKTESVKPFFIGASVGIAMCGVMWIANLIAGA